MGKALNSFKAAAKKAGVSTGEYFVKDGLDIKGQANYLYQTRAKGGDSTSCSIRP